MQHHGRGQADRPLRVALGIALLLHCAVIFGVSFEAAGEQVNRPQIDVTLVRQPATSAPKDARHLAQANQLGSGDPSRPPEVSARVAAAAALPQKQAGPPPSQASPQRPGATEPVTAKNAERQVARKQADPPQPDPQLTGISPAVDQLNQQLADLQAELDEQSRAYADMPRVKRLTSVSARQSADAAYLHAWRQRVEAVGNQYYPEASVRYGIYGSLRLLVVIDHSGHLDNIEVLSSSGYALLDEAAIKIVRMAAPYSPFPPELRATTDKVEIVRTWQFQENRLSSG